MKNVLKEKLKAGQQTFGLWMSIASPDVSEALAQLPFDWFVFDGEHSAMDEHIAETLMMGTRATGVTPIYRVAWNDPVRIKRALDIGTYGLVIPWINTRKEALDAVRACKYPPEGIRGCGPRRSAYLDPDYMKTANDELLIIAQIETIDAVNNIDEILTVNGIDCYFIGPSDLSMSMNCRPSDPKVQAAIEKTFEAGKKYGVASGIYGGAGIPLEDRIKQGWQFVVVGSDLGFVTGGARQILRSLGRLK